MPVNAICCVSLDGTDFKTQEPTPFNKQWMSVKYKGSALKYEVAISIFSGDIVWINGPHRGGKHDLTIFREKLRKLLAKGEMVEADAGYRDVKCRHPDVVVSRSDGRAKARARPRNEP